MTTSNWVDFFHGQLGTCIKNQVSHIREEPAYYYNVYSSTNLNLLNSKLYVAGFNQSEDLCRIIDIL